MGQLPCTFCDGAEPGQLMVTAMTTGDTVIVGANCQMTYGLVLAGVTPDIIDEVLNDIISRLEAAQGGPAGGEDEDQDDDAATPAPPPAETDANPPPPAVASEDTPPAPASPRKPAPRRARKTTPEPAQRARTKATLAKRPDSAKSSADSGD